MDSWGPMFKTLKALMAFNAILAILQALGHDQMLNWGLDKIKCFGITGHHMQMGSYSVILSCLLGILSPWAMTFSFIMAFFCNSSWTLACAGAWLITWSAARRSWLPGALGAVFVAVFAVMAFATNKLPGNLTRNGRLGVWRRAIIILNERPLRGWGPGTFKGGFSALQTAKFRPQNTMGASTSIWLSAHNDFVQIAYEFGYPIFSVFMAGWLWILVILVRKSYMPGGPPLLAGFVAISMDMLVHLPVRLAELCPLMIAFLAYIEVWLKSHE